MFDFGGFNNDIPMAGDVDEWWDCYYCGNATVYCPSQCRKCNGIKGFIEILSRSGRWKRLMNIRRKK